MRALKGLLATIVVGALFALPFPATADQPSCPDSPGCKTQDDPDKNNPKFLESQLGNFNQGTADTCVLVKPGRDKPC